MEQKEFEEKLGAINFLLEEAKPLKEEIIQHIKTAPDLCKRILENLQTRDDLFIKYLKDVSQFDYTNEYMTPSDLFPGIRTAAQMRDPEELQKKTEEMKSDAVKITAIANNVNTGGFAAANSLKKCLAALSELMIQENQIYDQCMDLLNGMNSIYEVGQIASAT